MIYITLDVNMYGFKFICHLCESNIYYYMNLRIKEVCKEKGVTLQHVAEVIGVNRVSLSNSINGNPTIQTLEKIANALGVAVSELIDEPKTNTITCPHCGKQIKFEKGK